MNTQPCTCRLQAHLQLLSGQLTMVCEGRRQAAIDLFVYVCIRIWCAWHGARVS